MALMDKNLPSLTSEEVGAVTSTVQTLSLLEDIENAGGVPSLDQDTIDQLTQAKNELVALMDKNLPSLTSEEVGAVTSTVQTLSLLEDIENAGGVPSLDQDTIDQLTQAKNDLVALMDKNLPSLTSEEVGAVTSTVQTLSFLQDIVEAGGIPSLNQATIDQMNQTKTDVENLLNANLPIITEEQKAQTETILASVERLENMTVPDLTDRADEINTAKANVDFILGLSDIPTQAELDAVDAKVQKLAPMLPSWKR